MGIDWFKPRSYNHFDVPVGQGFAAKTADPDLVRAHKWLPLIHYVKKTKRYKPAQGRTLYKERDIMYPSHRDACILSRYAHYISSALESYYETRELNNNVIAYRKLGRSNYHFSADAYHFALEQSPCMVLCFDITGFFNHLDHAVLKRKLKCLLGVEELAEDWYKVFKHVTAFKKIKRDDLAAHAVFGPRFGASARQPIATIAELKASGIAISRNEAEFGIPQGTPISSCLSNIYMMDVDSVMASMCARRGALYQRYSDDILVVCAVEHAAEIEAALVACLKECKLELKDEKTDRVRFDARHPKAFQYLGFNISPDGAVIRPGSLSRQWRRAKRRFAKARAIKEKAAAVGKPSVVYTKKLRARFSPVGARNFSSYARRSAKAFGSKKIVRQVRRLERMADRSIRDLKGE